MAEFESTPMGEGEEVDETVPMILFLVDIDEPDDEAGPNDTGFKSGAALSRAAVNQRGRNSPLTLTRPTAFGWSCNTLAKTAGANPRRIVGYGVMLSRLSLQPPEVRIGPLRRRKATRPIPFVWRPSRERVENFLLDHMAWLALACFALAMGTVWNSAMLRESEPSYHPLSSAVALAAYEAEDQQAPATVPELADEVSTPSAPAASTPSHSPKQDLAALITATSVSPLDAFEEREHEVVTKPAPTSSAPAKSLGWEFSGKWGPTRAACSDGGAAKTGWLPLRVSEREARAGETVCAFRDKRRAGAGWVVNASCSTSQARWTAKVRLVVQGGKLHWSSERGSQVYVRCDRVNVAAR
jgi:hypothetical protein